MLYIQAIRYFVNDRHVKCRKSMAPFSFLALTDSQITTIKCLGGGLFEEGAGADPELDFGRGHNPELDFGRGHNPELDFGRGHYPELDFGRGHNPELDFGRGHNPELDFGQGHKCLFHVKSFLTIVCYRKCYRLGRNGPLPPGSAPGGLINNFKL